MSYDIYFKTENCIYDIFTNFTNNIHAANTTWNLREMIVASTGLEWKNEENNGFVKDIIPHIEKGLKELTEHPEKYKRYEAPNGWGTIEGCRRFFRQIIFTWDHLNPKVKEVATFWIE